MSCSFTRADQPCWGPVTLVDTYRAMKTTIKIHACSGHREAMYLPEKDEQRVGRLGFPEPFTDEYLASDDPEPVPRRAYRRRKVA